MNKIVTIDGPAGSGKSSVAKKLASFLNFKHLNSGLFYRYLTYKILESIPELSKIALVNNFIFDPIYLLFLDNLNVDFNKDTMIIDSNYSSDSLDFFPGIELLPTISQIQEVRNKIKLLQKNICSKYNVIADGRDCGTVVFPQAQIKFFLTASIEERSLRIFKKLSKKNSEVDISEIKAQVEARDLKDESRAESPLVKAKDSILIDSTGKNLEQTVQIMLKIIKEKL